MVAEGRGLGLSKNSQRQPSRKKGVDQLLEFILALYGGPCYARILTKQVYTYKITRKEASKSEKTVSGYAER